MNFSTTALSVLLLIAMAVPGYLLVKTKMLPEKAITYLSVLLLYVSQPFLSIRSFLEVSYTPQLAINLAVVFGVSLFLEKLDNMGAWLDTVTIYIAPCGALLCAVFIYFILGMPAIKKELNQGRKKPLGRSFDILAYIYVAVAAAVLVLGIVYGGIG